MISAAMLLRPVISAVFAHCILLQHACHHLRRRPIAGTDRMIRLGKDNFMTKRILIDARQIEETRVVVLSGTRIDDFDYETENRKQLKGNVYLARVTRVEPSLQAAFVEYGGNRQGFLAFSEIHPDYYRIPVEDREALIEAETAVSDDEAEDAPEDDAPETVGGESAEDEDIRPKRRIKRYKIQEVISRKQIMLVQVVKEERGNKGAALTTYLSLAGRYCVLMPNNSRGGGVSRKITNPADRKRLKTVVGGLDIAKGMAVIVRTAGAKRTKTEIARDYAYLSKLWDEIRNRTLESQAPCLIHEEGDLIKRSIRDMYTSEVDEVLVEGEEAYKTARNQMKMLIPSHLKNVKKFAESQPIFQHFNVESQMETIQSPQVTLKSGGYLVINQTEALVAVDVNSGKSTRERNIEETALKTNLEAADELARQLRLRDMSGLIVVDFIDMEDNRNQNAVERRIKDAMRNDRARVQIGSISHFGLLEMSRQRLRLSINESISNLCPHCEGTGRVRSIDTAAMQVLRSIEDEAQKGKMDVLHITVHRDIALFILNYKRISLADIESRFGLSIALHSDDTLIAPEYRVEREGFQVKSQPRQNNRQDQRRAQKIEPVSTSDDDDDQSDAANGNGQFADDESGDGDQPKRRRRGRRGGRRRRGKRNGEETQQIDASTAEDAAAKGDNDGSANEAAPASGDADAKLKKPARGRSRGRRGAKHDTADGETSANRQIDQPLADTSPADTLPANNTPAADAAADAANATSADSNDGEVVKNSNAARKTTRKKAAKKPAKQGADAGGKNVGSENAGSDDAGNNDAGSETAKPVAKKPARGRKPKMASATANDAAASDDAETKAVAKKPARAARPKKVTKAAASPTSPASDASDASATSANGDAEAGSAAANRAPISSAPQDVIEVGNADPAARKRGWWSRSD
jgi:ribonuclease E